MVILSTINTIYKSRVDSKPVFVFILNQAVADLALSVLVVVVVERRYKPGEEINTERKCAMQIGIWLWIVINSILSTILLTLDRLLYISTTIRYALIMNSSSIILALLFTWTVPVAYALTFTFLYRYNGDVECILGHLIPFQLTIIGIVSLSIFAAIIYVAYTIILIKFYKQKRRIRKSNQNVVLFSGENLKDDDEHLMNNSEAFLEIKVSR